MSDMTAGGREAAWRDPSWKDIGKRYGRHSRRDGLVSMLLQDRSALRLISAPHGFGKTALAWEYATRMRAADDVVWVRASDPSFIELLDSPARNTPRDDLAENLVVIDDLPYLDEERSERLSIAIERMLGAECEVIVTALPSHDCLRSRHGNRVIVRAADLLVSERECLLPAHVQGVEEQARAMQEWSRAQTRFLGRIPAVYWGHGEQAQQTSLEMLFSEKLPVSFFRQMFAMLLLQEAGFSDLGRIGCELTAETEDMLVDYPVFTIDTVRRVFSVPDFPLGMLRRAVESNGLASSLLAGGRSAAYLSAGFLFEARRPDRAQEVLQAFCTGQQCLSWLQSRGWELLDSGSVRLVENALQQCSDSQAMATADVLALRAWSYGLQGSWKEACHLAKRALGGMEKSGNGQAAADAGLAAYLALLAFGGCPGPWKRANERRYSSEPAAFLGSVVESCTEVELERSFAVDDPQRSASLEKKRCAPGADRVEHLRALFTGAADRLRGSLHFRIALHFLCFVDDPSLKTLVQDLGCDEVIAMRGEGVNRISEAFLVRDLWMSGYFSPLGRAADQRDARLLERAARVIRDTGEQSGYATMMIPWETGLISDSSVVVPGGSVKVSDRSDSAATLKTRLFGGFDVVIGPRYIGDSQWRRKGRLLFALLVLHQGRDVSRGEILSQLWPNVARTRALDSFYSLWSIVNGLIGEGPYLEKNGEFCRVNSRYVNSDVAEFERLSRALLVGERDPRELLDLYARIEALYCGGLLPGEDDIEYIVRQRDRYRSMYTDSMVAATDKALKQGDARVALWFARKGMEMGSRREDVFHALIKAQIAAGQRCSAIRTYFKCREYLREELGLDPSFAVQDLYDQLITVDPSLLKLDPASFRT